MGKCRNEIKLWAKAAISSSKQQGWYLKITCSIHRSLYHTGHFLSMSAQTQHSNFVSQWCFPLLLFFGHSAWNTFTFCLQLESVWCSFQLCHLLPLGRCGLVRSNHLWHYWLIYIDQQMIKTKMWPESWQVRLLNTNRLSLILFLNLSLSSGLICRYSFLRGTKQNFKLFNTST